MNRLALAFAVAFAVFAFSAPSNAQAQVELGPRLGIDVGDIEEFFIGADARFTSEGLPIQINPTFDYYFTEEGFSFFNLSINGLYPFGIDNQAFTPYAGAGLAIARRSFDDQTISTGTGTVTVEGESATDIGINLIFGATLVTDAAVKPFAEVHFTPVFSDPESINLAGIRGGVLFSL